ncbi:MAG: PAS domain S-box protein [Nitrospinota bacterium]|nr:PAS domain S-box protein [Nitrospinota bacterium]
MDKRNIYALLPVALIVGALAYFFHQADMRQEMSRLEASEKTSMSFVIDIISEDFSHAVADLEILSSSYAFDLYSPSNERILIPALAMKLLNYASNRALYSSLRFIDASGMEKVRVDYNSGNPLAADEINLKSVTQEPYFSEAMNLARGEAYITLGKDPQPGAAHSGSGQRRILFLAPVFNGKAEKIGLIALDFLTPLLEKRMRLAFGRHPSVVTLVDGQGEALLALGNHTTGQNLSELDFAARLPKAWQSIIRQSSGQIQNEEGFFTFSEVSPVYTGMMGVESIIKLSRFHPIRIISMIPAGELSSQSWRLQGQLAALYLFFFVLLALAARLAENLSGQRYGLPNQSMSPILLMAVTIVIIYISEFLVMLALQALPPMGHLTEAAIDATFLSILILPLLSFFMIRPLMEHIRQKQMTEQSLRKSEENIKAIIKSAGEGIVVVGADFRITLVNEELLNIFGYKEEELSGQNISILSSAFSAGAGKNVKASDSSLFRDLLISTGRRLKALGRRKNGKEFTFEARFERTPGSLQESFYVGSIRDISDIELAQQALSESEEKFRSSFENAAIGMVLTDLEGKFLSVNPAFCLMTGYSRDELLSRTFAQITHPEDVDEDLSNLRRAIAGQIDTFQLEKRYVHKQGEDVWVNLNVAIVRRLDRTPRFFIAHIQDISERKKTETELIRAKEDAEGSTLLKDKFVSLVAHDLRSPFVSITGLLRLLLTGKERGQLSEKQEMMIKSALDASEQSVELIDELLNISRLKTGVIKPRRKFLDARNVGLMAMVAQAHLAARKNVTIINEIADGIRIFADPRLFVEVISNLVGNAIKFSNSGGVIRLSALEGGESGIAVTDQGVGVRKEYNGKLFRYDEKTHTTGTMGESGTGLGLPLSYDIMLAHGGAIDYAPNKPEGSVFRAILPRVAPRILVVEKDRNLVELMETGFSGEGVEFVEAVDFKAGKAALESVIIHAVIADIENQPGEALEFIRFVTGQKFNQDLPLIAIIAAHQAEEADRVLNAGAADFATKPLDVEAMIARVRRFIQ